MHATTVIDRLHTTLCLRATQDEATTR
jgi:hypothetical protein